MHKITESHDVGKLVEEILSSTRLLPICVVTAALDGSGPYIDAEEISNELESLCDFFYLEAPHLTRELSTLLPENTGVFGGAVRIFRTDFHDDPSTTRAKLFNLRSVENGALKKPNIVEEIWAAANAAGVLKKVEERASHAVATIKQFVGESRVFVKLDSDEIATIQQELFAPEVPLEWVFSLGQRVEGSFDSELKVFIPKLSVTTVEELASHYGLNSVTLGLVREANRQSASIAVTPGLVFEVTKDEITGNHFDVISSHLDIGDVIPVRIYRHPEGKIRLRMNDIDDDDTVLPALAIISGGEPWLVEYRDIPRPEPEPITGPESIVAESLIEEPTAKDNLASPSSAIPMPGPGLLPGIENKVQEPPTTAEVGNLRRDNKQLIGTVASLKTQNERLRQERAASDQDFAEAKLRNRELEEENSSLKTKAAEARKAVRAKQANRSTSLSRRQRFSTDQEWFLEEVRRAWLGRYTPQERIDDYPLRTETFSFSSDFFPSILERKLDDDELRKLVRVVLDLVTGRNAVEHKHTVHAMQDGLGGAQRTRSDGSLCWRMHLENGQPQAKRLHYWQLRDGQVQLGWVANHDEDL